ncbi:MAG: hypothetical protein LBK69_04635, partial [Syntrophomonadaceae bacterium]|nr:hypothetical protein [Syntrophomonadaceae bacterium]
MKEIWRRYGKMPQWMRGLTIIMIPQATGKTVYLKLQQKLITVVIGTGVTLFITMVLLVQFRINHQIARLQVRALEEKNAEQVQV